jgi:hypothetical protein
VVGVVRRGVGGVAFLSLPDASSCTRGGPPEVEDARLAHDNKRPQEESGEWWEKMSEITKARRRISPPHQSPIREIDAAVKRPSSIYIVPYVFVIGKYIYIYIYIYYYITALCHWHYI